MEKTEKIKILYIDDEVNNLIGFKASFRLDYNVLTANNTTEAKAQLEQHSDVRVILSDQRMPDKTGAQFFEEISTIYPNPIRILITGYADIESVIDAINKGHIYRYISKPWADIDIRSAVDEANKFYVTTSLLAVKNEELQRAYNELDKFAYSVTHDIRGPLLSVIGAIEVAEGISDPDEIKEVLDMMSKSAHKLDEFIRNMHDYYNLKRGNLQIADIQFDNVVKDLKDIYDITGKLNDTRFIAAVNQQESFRSDEISLKIILNNLLSNAFKYQRRDNNSKEVTLQIEVGKGLATIEVKDNGIGIAENNIGDIFNMFYRANVEEIGSGFGLYNVKDALNRLNGEISVQSIPGEGTTFKVTIPSK